LPEKMLNIKMFALKKYMYEFKKKKLKFKGNVISYIKQLN